MTANILIIDDLEPNIKVLEAKLLNEYYTVFTANSGPKALAMLAKTKIDIILLDVMMPIMDGFEVCALIKSNPETAYIPVIMVTALTDVENKIKGLKAGADDFLAKPINDTELFARVKSLSRIKTVTDELKFRNQISAEFGENQVELITNFSNSRIIIIDDDVVQIKNLSKIIYSISSNIILINDAEDVKLVDQFSPDLIIISTQIAIDDPLRVCSNLRNLHSLRHSIIIFLADEEDLPMVIKGMDLGINDYFIYPVDENELIARITTQLRKKYYQDNLRQNINQEISFALKDSLTGLYNRRYFDIHFQHLINKSLPNKSYCLCIVDIDHFKVINDTYGHQTGDEALKTVANILKNNVRLTDLVSRYGGEEFAIILKNISNNDAITMTNRLREIVETTKIEFNNNSIYTTVSIGINFHSNSDGYNESIEKADKALYLAKNSGRNRVEIVV